MFLKYRGKFLWWMVRFALHTSKWEGVVKGIQSLTPDGKHILLMDYDNLPLEIIKYDIFALQESYNIGDVFVIRSSPGKYHVVCFDKFSWQEINEIIEQSHCDRGFKAAKNYTLRTTPKKGYKDHKPVLTIRRDSHRQQSSPHMVYYGARIVGMRSILVPKEPDGLYKAIPEITYST